jgi:biopolymer transport protein ExbB/TolQ
VKIRFDKSGSANLPAASPGDGTERVNKRNYALLASLLGVVLSAGFYAFVYASPFEMLRRYFLGHPISVAETILFWFAIGILLSKWLLVTTQSRQLAAIRDADLMPPEAENGPASRWLEANDAGHVARRWLESLTSLPADIRHSQLVSRLHELLTRQAQRGSSRHLADDLRELSARDLDAAHDTLGLVRIIIWAIPMLGFLGTVVGITQTLGGLNFTDGAAAVENLKTGLYVAFDTTAIGLVMSVLAIFVQFPIERHEQTLLANIDSRVGHLISSTLPGDEASDNQTALIAELCRGVQAAVAESLENQATLWNETISEARRHWQLVHNDNANRIVEAIEISLIPALNQHARNLNDAGSVVAKQLESGCSSWREVLEEAQTLVQCSNRDSARALIVGLESTLQPSLRQHASAMDETTRQSADRLERQWTQWQGTIQQHSESLLLHQQTVIRQFEMLAETQRGTESILALQKSLDANLQRLNATNSAIDRSVSAAAGDGMAEAMRFLARAVDVLAKRLPSQEPSLTEVSRRAA